MCAIDPQEKFLPFTFRPETRITIRTLALCPYPPNSVARGAAGAARACSNQDGSLIIAIGPKPVSSIPESNWLPSAEGRSAPMCPNKRPEHANGRRRH
jgi:hypothetical protein